MAKARRSPVAKRDSAAAILVAAEALFSEHGFDGTGISDVATRAGVTKALVFYHFGSKERLLEAVLERYYEAHAAVIAAAIDAGGTKRERVRRVVAAYVDFLVENHRYPRIVLGEIARGSPRLPRIADSLRILYGLVAGALDGLLPKKGPLAAPQFFLTIAGTVTQYGTYASVYHLVLGRDPLGPAALAERKEHVLWLVEVILDRLEAERPAAAAARRGRRRSTG